MRKVKLTAPIIYQTPITNNDEQCAAERVERAVLTA